MNDYDLILDYLSGNAVPEDFRSILHRWVVEHSDDPEQLEAMRKVWEQQLSLNRDSRDTAGLKEVMSEIDPEWDDSKMAEYITASEPIRQPFHKRIRKSVKFAAASLIVVLLATISYFLYTRNTNDTVMLMAAKGATAEYTLPDGSMVRLNGDSRLSYNSRSFAANRQVILDGEAYFDVVHDTSHPFCVYMSGFTVEVLGTTFDARNYSHSPLKEVVLLSGKVKVEDDKTKGAVTLYPDQRYVYNVRNGESTVEDVKAEEYCSWYLESYKIEQEPLKKVLIALSRKYCLDLEIDPKVDVERKLSITISDEPVESVMGTISYIADFQYEIDDNTLRIKNK